MHVHAHRNVFGEPAITIAEGAGEHTHAGAVGRAHQVMFDWLSLILPSSSLSAFTIVPRYKVTVCSESPSTPCASQPVVERVAHGVSPPRPEPPPCWLPVWLPEWTVSPGCSNQ